MISNTYYLIIKLLIFERKKILTNSNGFSDEALRRIAAQKVNFRMSVRIHVGVYVVVSILLFFINLITLPEYLWIVYVFFGWLVGVALHSTSYLLYARGVYPMAKRGVIYHFVSFIFVIGFLFIINIPYIYDRSFTGPLSSIFLWAIIPTVFWGTGLIIHYISYLVFYRGKITEEGEAISRRELAIEKELEKMRNKQNREQPKEY